MKSLKIFYLFLAFAATSAIVSCQKDNSLRPAKTSLAIIHQQAVDDLPAVSIEDLSIDNITQTTAIVHFVVNNLKNTEILSHEVQYSTNDEFAGFETKPTDFLNIEASGTFNAELTNLQPDTKYYARVRVKAVDGREFFSKSKSFTTKSL